MTSLYMTDTGWPSLYVTTIGYNLITKCNMAILQEGLNSLIPLTQTIYKYYQMFSKNYFFFRWVPRDCHLMVYGQNHAKINYNNGHYAILFKYIPYFITKLILGIY